MSSDRYCCVPGCKESGNMHKVLHGFPNPVKDTERFNTWMYAIGGDILGFSNAFVHKLRRVCHSHFEEKYFNRYDRINKTAIPTLNLPGPRSLYTNCAYQPRKVYSEPEQPKSTEKYEDASLWEQNTAAAAKTIEYDDIESQVSPEDVEKEITFSWQRPVEVIEDTDDQPDPVPSLNQEVDLCSQEQDQEMFPKDNDEAWARKEDGVVTIHFYKCNICSKDISGSRYVCVQCVDFDLCGLCEAAHTHDQHYVLRVPQPKPHSEVMAVLRIIRHALVMDAIVDVSAHTQPDVEVVKVELEDPIEGHNLEMGQSDVEYSINKYQVQTDMNSCNRSITEKDPIESRFVQYNKHSNNEMDTNNSENVPETLDPLVESNSNTFQSKPYENVINIEQNSPKSETNSKLQRDSDQSKVISTEENRKIRKNILSENLDEYYCLKKRKTVSQSLHMVTHLKPRLSTSSRSFEQKYPSSNKSSTQNISTQKKAPVVSQCRNLKEISTTRVKRRIK